MSEREKSEKTNHTIIHRHHIHYLFVHKLLRYMYVCVTHRKWQKGDQQQTHLQAVTKEHHCLITQCIKSTLAHVRVIFSACKSNYYLEHVQTIVTLTPTKLSHRTPSLTCSARPKILQMKWQT